MSEFGGSSTDPNCAQDVDWMLTQLEQNAYDPNKPAQVGFGAIPQNLPTNEIYVNG